jgi:hypothetical protein
MDVARTSKHSAEIKPLETTYRHLLEAALRFLEPCVHGAHDGAVFELGEAEIQRSHEARIMSHVSRIRVSFVALKHGVLKRARKATIMGARKCLSQGFGKRTGGGGERSC